MKSVKTFLPMVIPIINEQTALFCLYALSISTSESGVGTFSYPLYLLCAAAAILINRFLLARGIGLYPFIAANLLLSAAVCLMLLSASSIRDVFSAAWALLFFIYPVARSIALARSPAAFATMLMYTEISILATGVLLILQIPGLDLGAPAYSACAFVILLNLSSLSVMRVLNSNKTAGKSGDGLRRGGLLFFAVLAAVVLALLLGLYLMPLSRELIVNVMNAVVNGIVAVITAFFRWLAYILSLLPSKLPDAALPSSDQAQAQIKQNDMNLLSKGFEAFISLFMILVAVGLAAILLYLLYGLRKTRLRLRLPGGQTRSFTRKSDGFGLLSALAGLGRRVSRALEFWVLLIIRRSTAPGVYIRLQMRGRLCGCPRFAWQTPREFLQAVGRRFAGEDEEIRQLLERLTLQIEELAFSGGREEPQKKWEKPAIKRLTGIMESRSKKLVRKLLRRN